MTHKHTILFTGLSGNLGREILPKFIDENFNIISTYFDDKELDLIDKKYSRHVNFIKCNLIKEKEVKSLEKKIIKLNSSVDTIINLVGGFSYAKILDTSLNDLIKMLELNFYTVYNVSKIAPKLMENSSNSSMINIITPYAEIPVEGTSLYSSSKAALMNFSRSLALEFREHKIRVNSLMCNTIDASFANFNKDYNTEIIEHVLDKKICQKSIDTLSESEHFWTEVFLHLEKTSLPKNCRSVMYKLGKKSEKVAWSSHNACMSQKKFENPKVYSTCINKWGLVEKHKGKLIE